MTNGLRNSGIGAVGDIPWGTHFCHFYEDQRDLLDVLVPYFQAGLEQNEFCVWGVFDPLGEHQARHALECAMPGAAARFAAGDIQIVPESQWDGGVSAWQAKLDAALARGCAGMRVSVSAAWLDQADQRTLDAGEEAFGGLLAGRPIVLLCAYPLADRAPETPGASYAHRFAIARRHGHWQVVETPELREARDTVTRLTAELERAEQALRTSAERSLCYFELGLVGMAIVSPAKGCIEVNARLCDILGYERGELMRMTWAALVHPDDLAVDIRNYGRILAGEVDGYQIEKRWIRKNGDVVHTNSSLKCHRCEDGSVDYFAAMVVELTGLGPSAAAGPAGAWDLKPGAQALSGRELEVTRLLGFGRTVKEIAAGLALSEKTVSTYRTRILTKLNLKSTAELMRYALQNRLSE